MSSITSLQGKRKSIALRDNLHGFGATKLASSRSASVSYPGGGSGFLDGSKLLYYTSSGLTSGAISNIISTSSDFTVTHSIGASIPSTGRYVLIAGCSTSGYNNIWEVSSSTSNTCVVSCPLNLGTPTTKGTLYFFGTGVLNETQSNVIISENGSFLTSDTNDSLVMLYKTSGYIVPRVDVTAKMYLMAGGGSGGGSGRGYSSYTVGTTASGSAVTLQTSSSSYSHIVKHPTASIVFIANDRLYSTTTSGVRPYSISAAGAFTAKTLQQVGATSQSIQSLCIDPAGKYLYLLNRTAHTVHLGTINQSTYEVTVSATSYTTNLSGYTGTTPYHAQVDRTGKFLFVLCVGNGSSSAGIAVFTINQTDGTLTGASFTTIASFPSYSPYNATNINVGKIAVHPTLNRIYCASTALYGFNYYSYDGTTGALTFISRWDHGNTAALIRSVAINATGTALVVGGTWSAAGSVWPFSLDISTGNYTFGTRSDGGGSLPSSSYTIFDPTGYIIIQPGGASAAYTRHYLYTPSTNTATVSSATFDRSNPGYGASTAVVVNGCVVSVSEGNTLASAQSYTISVTTADTYGGGGGAGAMSGYNGTNTYTLLANNIYQLSIGAGGAGSTGSGSNGTNSVLTNLTAGSTVYTASGGGKGGSAGSVNGSTGGCGGGGSGNSASTATTGGTSDSSFYAGGAGSSLGGQGGGLNLAGGASGSMSDTGVTTVGTALSSLYYHFGGGGFAGVTINNNGFPLSQYLYGAGIGQYGIPSVFTSMSAAPNTGSGGGGTAYISSSGTGAAGGNGGSGFLLIQVAK